MSSPTYDKAHFIAKLSAIPDHLWSTGAGSLRHEDDPPAGCALWHCGARWGRYPADTSEAQALYRLFGTYPATSRVTGWRIPRINDGFDLDYPQSTPKARVLAALADLPDTP